MLWTHISNEPTFRCQHKMLLPTFALTFRCQHISNEEAHKMQFQCLHIKTTSSAMLFQYQSHIFMQFQYRSLCANNIKLLTLGIQYQSHIISSFNIEANISMQAVMWPLMWPSHSSWWWANKDAALSHRYRGAVMWNQLLSDEVNKLMTSHSMFGDEPNKDAAPRYAVAFKLSSSAWWATMFRLNTNWS